MFASLHNRNFRLFATGQLISNIGKWVQRIAQDWLVLTLTGSVTAVGITTALQFLPTVLFGLYGGVIADRYPKRRVLVLTQIGMASMAGVLAVLALTNVVQAWHVCALAFGLGLVITVDNPARQAFVNEMVGPTHLRNAISLNSSVFQLGALVGPAISGVLLGAFGAGWAFVINALSFAGPAVALLMMRERELNLRVPTPRMPGQLREGLRYVAARSELLWPTVLVGTFGMFTTNLAVTQAAFAKNVFHTGASGYGLLSSVVAVGAVAGALASARMARTRLRSLVGAAFTVCLLYLAAAAAPGQLTYMLVLVPLGAATLILLTAANSLVQIASGDAIRGRVMGVYLLVFIGGGTLGGPLIGWIDEVLGPRFGMLTAGLVPLVATTAVALRLAGGVRGARVSFTAWQLSHG